MVSVLLGWPNNGGEKEYIKFRIANNKWPVQNCTLSGYFEIIALLFM